MKLISLSLILALVSAPLMAQDVTPSATLDPLDPQTYQDEALEPHLDALRPEGFTDPFKSMDPLELLKKLDELKKQLPLDEQLRLNPEEFAQETTPPADVAPVTRFQIYTSLPDSNPIQLPKEYLANGIVEPTFMSLETYTTEMPQLGVDRTNILIAHYGAVTVATIPLEELMKTMPLSLKLILFPEEYI